MKKLLALALLLSACSSGAQLGDTCDVPRVEPMPDQGVVSSIFACDGGRALECSALEDDPKWKAATLCSRCDEIDDGCFKCLDGGAVRGLCNKTETDCEVCFAKARQ